MRVARMYGVAWPRKRLLSHPASKIEERSENGENAATCHLHGQPQNRAYHLNKTTHQRPSSHSLRTRGAAVAGVMLMTKISVFFSAQKLPHRNQPIASALEKAAKREAKIAKSVSLPTAPARAMPRESIRIEAVAPGDVWLLLPVVVNV